MTYRVIVTARARADAVKQFHFLVDRSPAAAARWFTGLEKAIAKLEKMPERHPVVEDESEQLGITLREMLYGRRIQPLAHPVFPLSHQLRRCFTQTVQKAFHRANGAAS